jgi:cell division protein ZapA (FtsZ GTPase activity inhibitor)
MSGNRIKLSICGCDFALCSDDDEAYIRSVGDEVQKSIDDMTSKNERLSTTMAAVITAMNYCDAAHKASASADNLRTQIKNYLEDSSHARMDAEESHRELEKIRRENQTLRARLAAAGGEAEQAPEKQQSAAPEAEKPAPEDLSKAKAEEQADQETFMSFFEKKTDEP